MVVGQHSTNKMRVPGDSCQDDVQPMRTQTPRVAAGQVAAVLGVEGPLQTGILWVVRRLGNHRPAVVASSIGGRPRSCGLAVHTNLFGHLNPFEPAPPMEGTGTGIPVRIAHYSTTAQGEPVHAEHADRAVPPEAATHTQLPVGDGPTATGSHTQGEQPQAVDALQA